MTKRKKNLFRSRVILIKKDYKQLILYIDFLLESNTAAAASELMTTYIQLVKSSDVINYSVKTEKIEFANMED